MVCEVCGKEGKIHIHHLDEDHGNNESDNKIALCPKCHRKQHDRPLGQKNDHVFNMPRLDLETIRQQYETCHPRA